MLSLFEFHGVTLILGVVTTLELEWIENGIFAFNSPMGVRCDTVGNIFVAEELSHKVRVINTAGAV